MPQHVVNKVGRALNEKRKSVNGARILVIGVAYKRGNKDTRESPAIDIITHLAALGADIAYCDPHVPELRTPGLELTAVPFGPESLAASDLVLIVTDHPEFDYDVLVEHAPLIVDTRNALKGRKAGHIRKL
jgi:UDP-N-acetyl-D-mannosaminuronate dehydrogenase